MRMHVSKNNFIDYDTTYRTISFIENPFEKTMNECNVHFILYTSKKRIVLGGHS